MQLVVVMAVRKAVNFREIFNGIWLIDNTFYHNNSGYKEVFCTFASQIIKDYNIQGAMHYIFIFN